MSINATQSHSGEHLVAKRPEIRLEKKDSVVVFSWVTVNVIDIQCKPLRMF